MAIFNIEGTETNSFTVKTHPIMRQGANKIRQKLLDETAKQVDVASPLIRDLAQKLRVKNKMLVPEVVVALNSALRHVTCEESWNQAPEINNNMLFGVNNLSVALYKSGIFEFTKGVEAHIKQVQSINDMNDKKYGEITLVTERLVQTQYDAKVVSDRFEEEFDH